MRTVHIKMLTHCVLTTPVCTRFLRNLIQTSCLELNIFICIYMYGLELLENEKIIILAAFIHCTIEMFKKINKKISKSNLT